MNLLCTPENARGRSRQDDKYELTTNKKDTLKEKANNAAAVTANIPDADWEHHCVTAYKRLSGPGNIIFSNHSWIKLSQGSYKSF